MYLRATLRGETIRFTPRTPNTETKVTNPELQTVVSPISPPRTREETRIREAELTCHIVSGTLVEPPTPLTTLISTARKLVAEPRSPPLSVRKDRFPHSTGDEGTPLPPCFPETRSSLLRLLTATMATCIAMKPCNPPTTLLTDNTLFLRIPTC